MEIYKETFCCQECYSDITDSVSCKNLECPQCGAVQNLIDTSITIGVEKKEPVKVFVSNGVSEYIAEKLKKFRELMESL